MQSRYKGEYHALGQAIWKKGYRKGMFEGRYAPEMIEWTSVAIEHWYTKRISTLIGKLSQATTAEHTALRNEWNALMEEMFGYDQTEKNRVTAKLPNEVRSWL